MASNLKRGLTQRVSELYRDCPTAVWITASIVGIVVIFFSVVYKAWIDEDAYITYRTVLNFHEGFGLRWNIDERVQTYTHPLWFWLHVALYPLIGNLPFVSVLLSVVFFVCAITLLFYSTWRFSNLAAIIGLAFIPLMFSKSIQIWAISGFEIPLTMFLLSLFFFMLADRQSPVPWFRLSLIASLVTLNRQDTLLLYAPVFAYLIVSNWKSVSWRKVIFGFSPLVLWELFSLFYYGFPFPNTKYAKMDTGILLSVRLKQGLNYWLDLVELDLISAVAIVAALVLTVAAAVKWWRNGRSNRWGIPLFCGMGLLLQIMYIFNVGGAYLSFRFWAIPYFVGLMIIHQFIADADNEHRRPLWGTLSVVLLFALALQQIVHPFYYRGRSIGQTQLKNAVYCGHYNHWQTLDHIRFIIGEYYPRLEPPVADGATFREEANRKKQIVFKRYGSIGRSAIAAGPAVVIYDEVALAAPLLARLPVPNIDKFARAGHHARSVPEGYRQARIYDDFTFMDEDLATYYEALRLITTGPLFSWERLETVALFNLGYYDKYKEAYVATMRKRFRR